MFFQRVQMLDLDFQLGHPSDGFVSVRNPNGRLAIVTGRSDQLHNARLAVATDTGLTSVDVIVQNTLQDTSDYYVEVNSYAGDGMLTTTTTTTMVTVTSSGDEVDVFSLIVDEQTYYNSETGMLALQDNIIALASAYVNPVVDPANCFAFSEPRTCRERCHLTSSSERGCVYFSADVITSITCSYTNSRLRSDLTDDMLEEWADQVGADRIKVDECLESNETEWLVIVIAMPIFVVAVLAIGFVFTFSGQK